MNVASLELCKELYELSGWNDTDRFYMTHAVPDKPYSVVYDGEFYKFGDPKFGNSDYPAYDLGYLMRKLEDLVIVQEMSLFELHYHTNWQAVYTDDEDTKWGRTGHTPEDAACKLAIELFKQGVLK